MKIVILLKENESRMAKNLMGAMHQKIAIFKEENSVWGGTKFSNITKWHYFLDELNLKFKTKHVIIIFAKYIFWDSWQNCFFT